MRLLDLFIALFSKTMRSTLELERLNDIWMEFNDKSVNSDVTLEKLRKRKWRYHRESVDMLKKFIYARESLTKF